MDTVAHWLRDWRPPCTRLLLVGPSAGWTLPRAFVERFDSVTVLEPDPLARWRLRRHFKPNSVRFDDLNLFAPGGLAALREHYAGHAVLFANILGQLAPSEHPEAWCQQLCAALAPFHWASYHDLAATARPPDRTNVASFNGHESLDRILGHFWHGGTLEIVDHGTAALADGHPYKAVTWVLTPARHHLVAWVQHAPPA